MRHGRRRVWAPYALVGLATVVALLVVGLHAGWRNVLLTPDQRGWLLLGRGENAAAAAAFRAPLWRGVALFRSGDFKGAAQAFAAVDSAEAAFNQGNALVMLGQYDAAIKRYDRALVLRPDWPDAIANRDIASIRGERKKAEGGVNDDTESTPDDIVYDKTKKGGENTTIQELGQDSGGSMSDEAVRALWLKQVQTRPADFLRVKFSYQLQVAPGGGAP